MCCFHFYHYRWYFRKIKRIEAEKKLLLPENEHGAFLIRDSESRQNDYSLSGNMHINFFILFIPTLLSITILYIGITFIVYL